MTSQLTYGYSVSYTYTLPTKWHPFIHFSPNHNWTWLSLRTNITQVGYAMTRTIKYMFTGQFPVKELATQYFERDINFSALIKGRLI